ncbi:hypothetical protein BYT27DRAFT_7200541 [Phlegmacium glaucopus]|nr:hypothetical protein BYT27DRAFT_7200541 [Phlegmacium glaucopus]
MSVKEHYRVAIDLPHLPPEIWSSIFQLATWSTDIYNPQLMISPGCDALYWAQLREFKRSLVTKRCLVRVCKAWYYIASPFLFEYIFLGKGRVLAPLRDGMLRSEHAVGSQELPHAIGSLTRRLDVHMHDRTDDPGAIMDILADILNRLPNLRILTFAVFGLGYKASHYLPENVLQATNACRDTLRFLNCYGRLGPSPNSWASFLMNHPRLEAINAPVALTKLGNPHLVLNSLKSIYVHCYTDQSESYDENQLSNIDFPNIRHAIYDVTFLMPEIDSALHYEFPSKMEPQLTSVQINCLKTYPDDHDIMFAFNKVIQRITLNCERLTRVDFVIYDWQIPIIVCFPKNVHTLGIMVTASRLSKPSVYEFLKAIHDFLSYVRSVKTLCFTDQTNIRALRAHPHALSLCLDDIMELGVNVVDRQGRSLVWSEGTIT